MNLSEIAFNPSQKHITAMQSTVKSKLSVGNWSDTEYTFDSALPCEIVDMYEAMLNDSAFTGPKISVSFCKRHVKDCRDPYDDCPCHRFVHERGIERVVIRARLRAAAALPV